MVGFYLANMINQMLHGFGPFVHVQERDVILFLVYAIGYLNLIVGAYFILYLALRYRALVRRPARPSLS